MFYIFADYCAEKKCDHICISAKNGAECLCSVGYVLNEASGKCEGTKKDKTLLSIYFT